MAISMNANFGNYNPAQYQREDQSISRMGDRFANLASDIPKLWREGEKWQEERVQRDRATTEWNQAQDARAKEIATNEAVNEHVYNQMNKMNDELRRNGMPTFDIRKANPGEPKGEYANYVTNVFGMFYNEHPQLQRQIANFAAGAGVGADENYQRTLEKAISSGYGQNGVQYGQGGQENNLPMADGQMAPPTVQSTTPTLPMETAPQAGAGDDVMQRMAEAYLNPMANATRAQKPDAFDPHVTNAQIAANNYNEIAQSIQGATPMTTPLEGVNATGTQGATMVQPPVTAAAAGNTAKPAAQRDPEYAKNSLTILASKQERLGEAKRELTNFNRDQRGNRAEKEKLRKEISGLEKEILDINENLYPAPEKVDPLLPYKIEKLKQESGWLKRRKSAEGSGNGLYSANQTGHNQAQTDDENAYKVLLQLKQQLAKAEVTGEDTTELQREVINAERNLILTENKVRYNSRQTEFLGKDNTNIAAYGTNIADPKVMDLNRRIADNVTEKIPTSKDSHGQLLANGKRLFNGIKWNDDQYSYIGKILDDATRGVDLTDTDRNQIMDEVIEILRKQNIASLREQSNMQMKKNNKR